MGQKIKFVLVGLIGVALIFGFLYLQTLSSKQQIMRERDSLKEENNSLQGRIAKVQDSLRDYDSKIKSLNNELDKASREKQEIEKKYELVNKERGELLEKLKSSLARTQVQVPEKPKEELRPQVSDAYWAGILKAKTELELKLGNIRTELKSIQINNEQLEREKSVLELEIKNVSRDNEDLKRQLDYNQKLMDTISQELVRERNDKIKIQETFKSLKNENSVLVRQLKNVNERKIDLERKLQENQAEKAKIESRLTEMETMLRDKISNVENLKQRLESLSSGAKEKTQQEKREFVELPPIVVRPQSGFPVSTGALPEGRVLAVNKQNKFVIIDLGENQGIKLGDTFQVYREGKSIAGIEVIQTRRDIAACDIKRESTPVKIGDAVK